MANWRLQFDPEHKVMDYFDQCEERKAQEDYMASLIKKYSDPKYKSLEIGTVNGPLAPNWEVLDPFDKREFINYRFGLEEVEKEGYLELESQFDFIKCQAIFEHVKNPFACAQGLMFMMKQGGECLIDFPFSFPFHPFKGYQEEIHGVLADVNLSELKNDEEHGGDYWRYSPQAIKLLFGDLQWIYFGKTTAGSFILHGRKK